MAGNSYSPLLWTSFNLTDKAHQQLFLGQITDLLNFISNPSGLSTLLNGSESLGANALSMGGGNSGTIVGNITVNCAQSASIAGFAQVTTAVSPLITFTNMAAGTPFSYRFNNGSGSTVTIKFAATNASGSAYTVSAIPSGSAGVNMATGISITAGNQAMFSGASYGLNMDLMVNVT